MTDNHGRVVGKKCVHRDRAKAMLDNPDGDGMVTDLVFHSDLDKATRELIEKGEHCARDDHGGRLERIKDDWVERGKIIMHLEARLDGLAEQSQQAQLDATRDWHEQDSTWAAKYETLKGTADALAHQMEKAISISRKRREYDLWGDEPFQRVLDRYRELVDK